MTKCMNTENAVLLDPEALVSLWRNDSRENIKPSSLIQMVNPSFRGWYCAGRTTLKSAKETWQWNRDNLGKTFSE
jgi:hypothetical protein